MQPTFEALAALTNQPFRTILGVMSGTSLDGLDIALCEIHGSGRDTNVQLKAFASIPFDDIYRQHLASVFAKKTIDLQTLCLLNPWVASVHAQIILGVLKQWQVVPSDIDIVASHGQTIYHAPKSFHGRDDMPNATLQIGDGDHIAQYTGIVTLSDFRQKHIAAGGEGAPLVKYGDYLLCADNETPRVMVNIGGIANLTYLPAGGAYSDIVSSDVGPGNTLMDRLLQSSNRQLHFDKDAIIAKQGSVLPELLKALSDDIFFSLPLPKTTGPERFNIDYLIQAQRLSNTESASLEDLLATLNRFTAEQIAMVIQMFEAHNGNLEVFVSGGGSHNPLLMENLQHLLPRSKVMISDELGIPTDAKEAILFAVLANEAIMAKPRMHEIPSDSPNVRMGKISFPG